jgi:hypothetical protein
LENSIPKDIRNFLTDCIETVSQLELLFFILENKSSSWTADLISKELRTHPSMAAKQMEILFTKGILSKEEDKFSYGPQTTKLEENINQLYDLYHERPVAIVTYIFTKPEDKLKGFADAFKFKKD